MENLLVLLNKVQQLSPLPVLTPDIIIVHNAGMQHWLNLSHAQQHNISMNYRYVLPSQYLWSLVRNLASEQEVIEQTPYSREVLAWRIDELLASNEIISDDIFTQVTDYWQQEKGSSNNLKRFQLSCQIADLFEQYLLFRPDWLHQWQQGKVAEDFKLLNNDIQQTALWQAKLWQHLTNDIPYDPSILINNALNNLAHKKHLLPPRLTFFGINSLAPMWLDFIHGLSECIDIHFFHLNPCFDYWGDLLTEKQAIKNQQVWLDGALDDENSAFNLLVGNPLLANLGQQGREFLALLQNISTINIEAFQVFVNETVANYGSDDCTYNDTHHNSLKTNSPQHSVLHCVQNDILTLTDARNTPSQHYDSSITITSCHSALREVQALHDWLLQQFNENSALTPKDILVMCPQVEQYAPYISAVFSQGWQTANTPQDYSVSLPCSIADRVSKDSEPLVIAFIELLQLPDSRFQVSQLISWLRLPMLQAKFDICIEDIDKISVWLEQASIHWGLNADHKQRVLHLPEAQSSNEQFTWQQGLTKLLLGFAYGDDEAIYQNQLLLPSIEGEDSILLGKLLQILEYLQYYAQHLQQEKSAQQWQVFLQQLFDQLFIIESETAFELIDQAIRSLVDYCHNANYLHNISLDVVRDFLQNHFSQPDAGRQFLVGQITFCSMLPMRSIPFKVIAILGLNDGEFPRQRQALGFDLMANTRARVGDRSRRGDDRYLFLEALISAREALYLSYQGRNIRTNNELQPSLVLKELMEYLDLGYGWRLLNDAENTINENATIKQLPMQPFSLRNFDPQCAPHGQISFAQDWLTLALANNSVTDEETLQLSSFSSLSFTEDQANNEQQVIEISVDQLVKFFEHPSKYFAKQQLNLHFEQYQAQLSDVEPFENDFLAIYQLKEQLLAAYLQQHFEDEHSTMIENSEHENASSENTNFENTINTIITKAQLSGKFPDSPTLPNDFSTWQDESQQLAQQIITQLSQQPKALHIQLPIIVNEEKIILHADIMVCGKYCIFYRSSSAKGKDLLQLYITHLMIMVMQQEHYQQGHIQQEHDQDIALINTSMGWYFNAKGKQLSQQSYSHIDNAKQQLIQLIQYFKLGQQQSLLLNANIAHHIFSSKNKNTTTKKKTNKSKTTKVTTFDQNKFEQLWQDDNSFNPLAEDPYIQFFWRTCPDFSSIENDLYQLYQPLYEALTTTNIKLEQVSAVK